MLKGMCDEVKVFLVLNQGGFAFVTGNKFAEDRNGARPQLKFKVCQIDAQHAECRSIFNWAPANEVKPSYGFIIINKFIKLFDRSFNNEL